ncbi:hypothetical protein [Acidithiobacillus ferriphilus]|uniref:hypothetical protein n=1 Tax=Acidithiobacillus ferriphilus TaxID=1689834 RepID=UPI002DBF1C24|nr:hypothetical protein [Acidithiobacillus ferriphilus]MEB8535511.1 hypothetical protein [Acidithiobacillus ferriphilus]
MKDPEQQMAYWLTLQKQCFNPQLAEHQFNELRAALRDARQELQEEKNGRSCPRALFWSSCPGLFMCSTRGETTSW